MVMKSLKYEAFARFVRIVLPPFDKRMKIGEEMPGYKVELFHCLNTGSVWHKNTGMRRKLDFFVAFTHDSCVCLVSQVFRIIGIQYRSSLHPSIHSS